MDLSSNGFVELTEEEMLAADGEFLGLFAAAGALGLGALGLAALGTLTFPFRVLGVLSSIAAGVSLGLANAYPVAYPLYGPGVPLDGTYTYPFPIPVGSSGSNSTT